ncbi:MAG: hypothetical protein DRR19_16865 [Candidatus Parabeggiatoa sp. nov. 1]|nr:MAG: hypothetical protein DRR19_16865 [Gammaproteobacteria bacterium]
MHDYLLFVDNIIAVPSENQPFQSTSFTKRLSSKFKLGRGCFWHISIFQFDKNQCSQPVSMYVECEFEVQVFRRKTLASNRLSGENFSAQKLLPEKVSGFWLNLKIIPHPSQGKNFQRVSYLYYFIRFDGVVPQSSRV